MPNGILESVAKPLIEAGINLEYFYAYIEMSTDKAMVVLKTDDLEKTEKALIEIKEAGNCLALK